MDGETHRPKRHASGIDPGRIALRLIPVLLASACWCGQGAAQLTNQFGAKPAAPVKVIEMERATTASAARVPGLTNGERLGVNASTEPTRGEPNLDEADCFRYSFSLSACR